MKTKPSTGRLCRASVVKIFSKCLRKTASNLSFNDKTRIQNISIWITWSNRSLAAGSSVISDCVTQDASLDSRIDLIMTAMSGVNQLSASSLISRIECVRFRHGIGDCISPRVSGNKLLVRLRWPFTWQLTRSFQMSKSERGAGTHLRLQEVSWETKVRLNNYKTPKRIQIALSVAVSLAS